MSGFFARIIAQVAIVGVQVLTKAFAQALQRAQAGGGANAAASAARSAVMGARMSAEQARAVLNVGEKGAYTAADVRAQYEKYFEANDPDAGGSFYLQSKIHNAKETLLEELKAAEKEMK
jgi:import inner membrane translocase subunit TIM16